MNEQDPNVFKHLRIDVTATDIGELVKQKNVDYGDSVGKTVDILKIWWPNGIPTECYGDLQLMVRVLDKLNRLTTGNEKNRKDSWGDIAGYGIIGVVQSE